MFTIRINPKSRAYVGNPILRKAFKSYCKDVNSMFLKSHATPPPTPSPPPPPFGKSATNKWLFVFGTAALFGGAIACAKHDQTFRSQLVDVAPITDGIIKFIYQEEMSFYESIETAFTEISEKLGPEFQVQKEKVMELITEKVEPEFKLQREKFTNFLIDVTQKVHNKVLPQDEISLEKDAEDENLNPDMCYADIMNSSKSANNETQNVNFLDGGSGEAICNKELVSRKQVKAISQEAWCVNPSASEDLEPMTPATAIKAENVKTDANADQFCPVVNAKNNN